MPRSIATPVKTCCIEVAAPYKNAVKMARGSARHLPTKINGRYKVTTALPALVVSIAWRRLAPVIDLASRRFYVAALRSRPIDHHRRIHGPIVNVDAGGVHKLQCSLLHLSVAFVDVPK